MVFVDDFEHTLENLLQFEGLVFQFLQVDDPHRDEFHLFTLLADDAVAHHHRARVDAQYDFFGVHLFTLPQK